MQSLQELVEWGFIPISSVANFPCFSGATFVVPIKSTVYARTTCSTEVDTCSHCVLRRVADNLNCISQGVSCGPSKRGSLTVGLVFISRLFCQFMGRNHWARVPPRSF